MHTVQAVNLSRAFGLASLRCEEQRPLPDGRFEMLAVPAVVCLAFAVEVGVKAMLLKIGASAKGHSLSDLVGKLPMPARQTLVQATGLDEATFASRLSLVGNAFVEWRYIYESEKAQVDLAFLRTLNQAIQASIQSART
jgi:hypothetical protein